MNSEKEQSMLGRYKPLWGKKPRLKSSYDAVIIGGGLHGLATAYFLARDHGMTDVAILENALSVSAAAVATQPLCVPIKGPSKMCRFTKRASRSGLS
jgi:glycine/D-amino acid oxidase-like deaminating enzyme